MVSCHVVKPSLSDWLLGHHPVLLPPALWAVQPPCAPYWAKGQCDFTKMWGVCACFSPNADLKPLLLNREYPGSVFLTYVQGKQGLQSQRNQKPHKCTNSMFFCHVPTSCMALVNPLLFLGLRTMEWALALLQHKHLLFHLSPPLPLLLVRDWAQALHNLSTHYCRTTPSVFQLAFLAVYDFKRGDCSQGHQRNTGDQLEMGKRQWIWRRGEMGKLGWVEGGDAAVRIHCRKEE